MIDLNTTVKVTTSEGTYDFGEIRSVNFTVMDVGKVIKVEIYNEDLDHENVCGLIKAVGINGAIISIVQSSGQDDYVSTLSNVTFSIGFLGFSASF